MGGKKKQKFYVVWTGKKTGIFSTWNQCSLSVNGFRGAEYKSFPTRQKAEEAYNKNYSDYKGVDTMKGAGLSKQELKEIGQPDMNSICVDAACENNPGILEYRGVETATKRELFHPPAFPHGTINIGEFLALVHGMRYLKDNNKNEGTKKRIIYSDSRNAMAWVRDKEVRTTLVMDTNNFALFSEIKKSIKRLQENDTSKFDIRKRHTNAWGEIPADFGRK